jgi:hypothetical protein
LKIEGFDMDYAAIFGNDSGEDEDPKILDSYFVELPEFKRFTDEKISLSIVRARKGMGKSALLSHLNFRLIQNEKHIVVKVTGNELIGLGSFEGKGQAQLENHWKQVICKKISLEIGKKIGFAFTDQQIGLVEAAELEGYKDLNFVSSLTDRIGGLIKVLVGKAGDLKIDDVPGRGAKKGVENYIEKLRRYQEDGDIRVWLLIDDVDAKYKNDEYHQDLVGAFFSAIRSLAFAVKNLCVRASVRTDVWYSLRRMEDQDKLRQYVMDIKWRDDALRRILTKKILSYLQRENPNSNFSTWNEATHYHEITGQVFDRWIKWGNLNEEPFVPIKILAGARPRWMGQLCRMAGERKEGQFIGTRSIQLAMPDFGMEKINDMQKEHQHQFAELGKLVDAFRAGAREYNRFALISKIENGYIKKVDAVPQINGFPFKSSDQLGDFLFQIEFVSGMRKGSPRLILYQDDPELFQHQENLQNQITWVINHSYRQHLRIV